MINKLVSLFYRSVALFLLLALIGCSGGHHSAQDESLTVEQVNVRALYRAILQREADVEGLEFYSAPLACGEHNIEWVRESLRQSDEGVQVRKGIDRQYRSFRHLFRVIATLLGILIVLKISLIIIPTKRSVSS